MRPSRKKVDMRHLQIKGKYALPAGKGLMCVTFNIRSLVTKLPLTARGPTLDESDVWRRQILTSGDVRF